MPPVKIISRMVSAYTNSLGRHEPIPEPTIAIPSAVARYLLKRVEIEANGG